MRGWVGVDPEASEGNLQGACEAGEGNVWVTFNFVGTGVLMSQTRHYRPALASLHHTSFPLKAGGEVASILLADLAPASIELIRIAVVLESARPTISSLPMSLLVESVTERRVFG